MCADEQMGLCPWAALGDGKFKSSEGRRKSEGSGAGDVSEQQVKVSVAVEKLTKKKGASITGVALAYVVHKAPHVFPIYGGRKTDHLKGNIDTLTLSLSDKEMAEIDNAWPFDVGFPLSFLSQTPAGAKGQVMWPSLGKVDSLTMLRRQSRSNCGRDEGSFG
jgi:aryl-alcohol dehydrogenase-like predicted oxidoreductase